MAAATALLAAGYPASIVVLSRFSRVVRRRQWRWLLVHHGGVAAIVAGWALKGRGSAVAVNAGWLVASSVWYAAGGRYRPTSSSHSTAG